MPVMLTTLLLPAPVLLTIQDLLLLLAPFGVLHQLNERIIHVLTPAVIWDLMYLGGHPGAPGPLGAISCIGPLDYLSKLVSSCLLLRLHFLQLISSSLLPCLLGRSRTMDGISRWASMVSAGGALSSPSLS